MDNEEKQQSNQNNNGFAIKKIIEYGFLFLVFAVFGTLLLNRSLRFNNQKVIQYREKSNLDYKVYLLENDFYDKDYLGKDMLYVASLIDKININFDYLFESDEEENIDFTYNVVAKLSITNSNGTKSYYENSYTLLDKKKVSMIDNTSQGISEEISIDYPYYNSLTNNFRNQYGVDTNSKLVVYMLVNKNNVEGSSFKLDNNSVMSVEIPLSEKAVDISLDYKDINETNEIVETRKLSIKDIAPIVVAVVLIFVSLIFAIKLVRAIMPNNGVKSEFDKHVNKILKEYDRLIAESSSIISFKDKEVVNINKFTELLDIHDNLLLPIMYYPAREHETCYFYICHENIVYLLKIKKNDFDKK